MILKGGANQIPQVDVKCQSDEFENAIRKIGVVFACEWFGYDAESEWTKETIELLCERSGIDIHGDPL